MDSYDCPFSLCVQSLKQRWYSIIKLVNAELMFLNSYSVFSKIESWCDTHYLKIKILYKEAININKGVGKNAY